MVQSIRLSIPVLLFTLGTCTLTAILFGLLPVLKTSTSLADSLRPGDRGSTGRQGLSRGLLIAGEIAIAVVVLFLSTLVIRSFQKLLAVDPGFRTDHLLSLEITLPTPRYSDNGPETNRFFEQLLDRIAQSPGVHLRRKHNSASSHSFQGDDAIPRRRSPAACTRCISSGADPLCQSGLLPHHGTWPAQGRLFEQKDINDPTGFFIVNQAFAQRYLAGRNPVGANIFLGVLSPHPAKIPVIGVVSNAHDLGVQTDPQPEIYLPGFGVHEVLLVRTVLDPGAAVPLVQNAVHQLDRSLPIYHVQTIEEVLSDSLARQRMTATLLGIFSLVALSLAAVGIYGVLAYSITQRTREIGVRMAVGAKREDILRMVLSQTAKFALAGIGVGLAVAFAGAHLLSALLFKTSAADPLSACLTAVILLVIAALAVSLPARKAASVSPTEALRAE